MPLLFYRLSDSFVSLSYLFRVGRTTISEILLDGCEAEKQVSTGKQHAVVVCSSPVVIVIASCAVIFLSFNLKYIFLIHFYRS